MINLNKVLSSLIIILQLASCNSDKQGTSDEIPSLHPAPLRVALNIEEGYIINPLTGDSIQPVINSLGDTIKTGVPVPAIGKVINPKNVAQPTIIPAGEPEVIPINLNVHKIPESLTIIPVNKDLLKTFTPGVDTSSYVLVNSMGDTVPTGVPIPVKGKIVPCKQPKPVKALPPRMKENTKINMKYMDMEQGLNSSIIKSILEDSRGNIWLASWGGVGVSMYNGETFTHFTETEGLGNNFIYSILEDSHSNLWVGTGRGVSMYNGETFTHFTETEGLSNNEVRSILEDNQGNLWFGTCGGGVSMYNGESFTHFTEKEGLSNNNITSILEDRNGNLWLSTWGEGVSMYNGDTFTHFTQKDGLNNNSIERILEDSHGNLWFGTFGGGVSMYNGETFTHFTKNEGLSNNHVKSILEDRQGNLWFGTNGGVNKYNGKTFTHFTEKEGLSDNDVTSILEDSYGNLWFGTAAGGVSIYNDESFTHFIINESINSNGVTSILEDSQGNLWFGIYEGGVIMYNDETLTHITKIEGLNNFVLSIMEDRNGNLWFSSGGGVYMYNGKTFTHFTEKEGLSNNWVMSILEDRQGNLWFSTWRGGVSMYNGESFTHFTEKEGLISNDAWSILEDSHGNLWFGTNGGLSMYNGETFTHFTEKEGLSINSVAPIVEDSLGNLWFGTLGGGVSMYNGKTFTHFTEKEGLSNNYVYSILEDRDSNIWLSTDRELNHLVFNPKSVSSTMNSLSSSGVKEDSVKFSFSRPVMHTYGKQDGQKGLGFWFNSILLDSKNRIWWGSYKGLDMLDMNKFKIPGKPPTSMQLNRIEINGQFADYRNLKGSVEKELEFNGVARFYNYPLILELPYKSNHLSFYFSAIDWAAPHKISYQYMLKGFDQDWSQLTGENKALYRKIPPGSYTFKVRAIGAANIWSDTMEYSFIVNPPWYRTILAYIIYGLILLTVILGLIRLRIRSLIKDKEELEKQVKERTREIEERDFHILEMDRMKTRFFANISHEFRTPLTLILNPIEDIIQNNKIEDKVQKSLRSIRRNGQKLLDLVNQLLDLSKLDSGEVRLELTEADVIKTLRLTFSSFISLADKKRIQYIFQLPEGEMVTYFDRRKLETILNNLLSNAFKYTPEDGEIRCNVHVNEAKKEGGNDIITISVKDSGPGIDENKLDLIFDRFYQADEQHHIEGGGSGIGLSLTKELVDLIHGQIKVTSKPGEGSCFKLSIPLGKDHLKESEYVMVEKEKTTEARLIGETIFEEIINDFSDDKSILEKRDTRILIVEDNFDLREYIKEQFHKDYLIEEAADGEEGLRKAIKSIPDLIISDIMMPRMDGIEFCRKVKTNERTSHVPVILLTAKADIESRIEGLETGADDYIIKPFNIEELHIRIRNLLDQRENLKKKFSSLVGFDFENVVINSLDEQFLKKTAGVIERRMQDFEFDVGELKKELGISRVHLYRKLKALTGLPPSTFIRNIRCKYAAKLMEQKYGSVTQIAYKVGFNNLSWFGKSFKEFYGISPSDYSRQFSS